MEKFSVKQLEKQRNMKKLISHHWNNVENLAGFREELQELFKNWKRSFTMVALRTKGFGYEKWAYKET